MESIIAAAITGALTLLGVIVSNSKSRAVTECKIDELARKVEAHNRMIERTYALEQDVAVLKNDVVTLYHKAGDK